MKKILTFISKYYKFILIVFDFLALNLTFLLSIYIVYSNFSFSDKNQSLLIFGNIILLLLIIIFSSSKIMRFEPVENMFSKSINKSFILILIFFLLVYIFDYTTLDKRQIVYFIFLFLILNILLKITFLYVLQKIRKKGINSKKIVIMGYTDNTIELKKLFLKELTFGYKILGFFDDDIDKVTLESEKEITFLGNTEDFYQFTKENKVDEVFIMQNDKPKNILKDFILYCENNLLRVKIVPDYRNLIFKRHINIDYYSDLPVLLLRKEPLDNSLNKFIKRTFDIIFSLIVIIFILSWVIPIISITIKLTSRGPVFFKQLRSGKENEDFICWKFRSMYLNKESDFVQAKLGDSRITPIGKFIRKTSIDEFPQFFNVLLGSMSIVGPRPHPLKLTNDYSKIINKYMVRHYVKPGITGLAQIKGFRGETSDPKSMENRVIEDINYIENWTFALDIKIIIKTVLNIFKGEENAY
ncbi:MAG: undecaprenyl-phosphate glucose phosphotransferase [Flavobacteriia bacterium]|nr:undecaprenyl-phosphate glucose phosphotransferase [Flavobacteriia bacterium]